MNGVITRLILKDLYLNRWLIGVVVVGGLLSLLIAGSSRAGFSVGGTLYLTFLIALGIILVMHGVIQERKDRSLLFVMSLPISPHQYVRAKVGAMLGIFVPLWALLSAGGLFQIATTRIPDGMIPLFALISLHLLAMFCVILGTALTTTSEPVVMTTVIVTNVSVTLLFVLISNIPSIASATTREAIVWNAPLLALLGAEGAIALVALTIPFLIGRHERQLA